MASTSEIVSPKITTTKDKKNDSTLRLLDMFIMSQPEGNIGEKGPWKSESTDTTPSFKTNHLTCHRNSCVRTLLHQTEKDCTTQSLTDGQIFHQRLNL